MYNPPSVDKSAWKPPLNQRKINNFIDSLCYCTYPIGLPLWGFINGAGGRFGAGWLVQHQFEPRHQTLHYMEYENPQCPHCELPMEHGKPKFSIEDENALLAEE